MKQSLTALLTASLLLPVYAQAQRQALIPKKKNKPLTGYWRRVEATPEEKAASHAKIEAKAAEREAIRKEKNDYLEKLSIAKEVDKKIFLENQRNIWNKAQKDSTEPFTFLAHFDSSFYYGINLELLNGSNQCDAYAFTQYLFDTGVYIHPHLHNLEQETLEFKAIARMKGIAGDEGRFLETVESKTKIGWAVTEYSTSSSFNKFSFWMRELWLKYYFDQDKKGFFITGLFPYSIGHGISLGYANEANTPFPGQYTFEHIDQFHPGVLVSNTFANDQASWELYLGIGDNNSTTFNKTAEFAKAQDTNRLFNVSRGIDSYHYILAGQIKALFATSNPDTKILANPYLMVDYDNTQKVEFPDDATSRLYTLGALFEWDSGPLRISFEGAQNMGHQNVKAWDRNELNFAALTWNSHLLMINPNIIGISTYPPIVRATTGQSFGVIDPTTAGLDPAILNENNYTHAIGEPPAFSAGGSTDYSRSLGNGTMFGIATSAGTAPTHLIYKNSNSRFRDAYKNSYRGWFLMGDVSYAFRNWTFGSTLGLISGDNAPNDSTNYILATRRFANDSNGNAFVYKDTNKKYKGFVGVNQMFKSKSISAQFIHEAQKLNYSLSNNSKMTSEQLTNLLFLGFGLKNHSVHQQKERLADMNFIFYAQKKSTTKGTNMPYTEFINLEYSAARQTDANKMLDTFLGFEFNASLTYNLTYDLAVSGQVGLFVPGGYYTSAEGKYVPFNTQTQLIVPDNTGIFTVPEQFKITLGNDTAFFATAGITYNFDSLFLKHKQRAFKPYKRTITKKRKDKVNEKNNNGYYGINLYTK